MASIEAVEALLGGVARWQEYRREHSGIIDLSFADLSEMDISGRELRECDLRGAQLAGANLDRSTVRESVLDGANLHDASIVDCTFRGVTARKLTLTHAVIRDSLLVAVELDAPSAARLIVHDSRMENCRIKDGLFPDARFNRVRMERTSVTSPVLEKANLNECAFADCSLADWRASRTTIRDSSFDDCRLSGWSCRESDLERLRFRSADVIRLSLSASRCVSLDFTGGMLAEVDTRQLGLATATLMDTSFVGCVWPAEAFRVGRMGQFIPGEHLMRQPVQDVKGVPPAERREIADAQYLRDKLARARPGTRALYALWGFTSAYGQSVQRLSSFTFFVVLTHSLALLASRGRLFGSEAWPYLLPGAFWEAAQALLGLAADPPPDDSAWIQVLYFSLRIIGVIIIGIWITVASNKISRLS